MKRMPGNRIFRSADPGIVPQDETGGGGSSEFPRCCAGLYEDPAVATLLGESFHPGGTGLTRRLLESVRVTSQDMVLDVAAGRAASAIAAISAFGCRVVATDLSRRNLTGAKAADALGRQRQHLMPVQADALALPFASGSFDVLLCECAYCTFVDREVAGKELFRVLTPGGRLALADMTVESDLPDELQGLLARAACIATAVPRDDLVSDLARAGFHRLMVRDETEALLDMVRDVERRALALELAGKLGGTDLGGFDLERARKVSAVAADFIRDGGCRWVTVTGVKPSGKE